MDLSDYQSSAIKTDQVVDDKDEKSRLVPLLGLAGEVGTLLSEYKKFLRDGGAHERFHKQVAEDLGDLLWYIANVATKFDLDLAQIAHQNLEKVQRRWPIKSTEAQGELYNNSRAHLLDETFSEHEQLPRQLEITFEEFNEGESITVVIKRDGEPVGDPLTDNAPDDDGYRFHDVFHLSYAAILGWSPIIRKLLKVKRKSDETADVVEDGARARIIEELISQLVFQYAREHNFLNGINTLDYHLLKTIHSLVQDREVRVRTLFEWENAILAGYRVWRDVYKNRGGTVRIDLVQSTIEYTQETADGHRRC